MSWNHRIARRVFNGPTGPEEFLSVYEVYYDDAGNPTSITSNACAPGGETLDEIRMELARMLAATGQPILDYDAIANGSRCGSRCPHCSTGACGMRSGHEGAHHCGSAHADMDTKDR